MATCLSLMLERDGNDTQNKSLICFLVIIDHNKRSGAIYCVIVYFPLVEHEMLKFLFRDIKSITFSILMAIHLSIYVVFENIKQCAI
jgi:23S rRNA A2030 N6-methylase RlmJ